MRQMKKTEMPVLELCQGSVSYPDGKQALKQVSAAFYPGEKVAVIGSNGAGKSTFFQTLNRITCLN
ncbi:MAG: ATP-binding cassette domain-containing protein, partial [Hungatella sp.]